MGDEDTLLEKIIKFFKRLFCKHQFQLDYDGEEYIEIQCKKCLKHITADKRYWYHMGKKIIEKPRTEQPIKKK